VLTTNWQSRQFDLMFPGGTENGAPLYICRADYQGSVQLGKYSPSFGCSFGCGGNEVSLQSGYEVLSNMLVP
jgi:hypothetical protein